MSLADLPLLDRVQVYIDEVTMFPEVREALVALKAEVEQLRRAEWTARGERDSMRRRLEMLHADESWWIGGAWGDYGEAVIPLRAVSMVLGDRDGNVAETAPGFACTYRDLRATVERQAAEVERLRPRRIESVEELDALPVSAVVRGGDGPGGIYEKDERGAWWDAPGDSDYLIAEYGHLTLLWEPGAQ